MHLFDLEYNSFNSRNVLPSIHAFPFINYRFALQMIGTVMSVGRRDIVRPRYSCGIIEVQNVQGIIYILEYDFICTATKRDNRYVVVKHFIISRKIIPMINYRLILNVYLAETVNFVKFKLH